MFKRVYNSIKHIKKRAVRKLIEQLFVYISLESWFLTLLFSYNCGPEATNAFASSLSQYCSKFLIYLAASDFAFVSHSATSA